MVQAKRNERVKVLIEVICLREEFSFDAGMLKGKVPVKGATICQ